MKTIYPENREDLAHTVIESKGNIIINAGTGVGKTKIALEKVKGTNVLIFVPKLINIDSWKDEMDKWKLYPSKVDIVTYASIHKYIQNRNKYDYIIFDEAHHLFGEKTFERFKHMLNYTNATYLFLTATLKNDHLDALNAVVNIDARLVYSISDSIDNNELPNIQFKLYKCALDDVRKDYVFNVTKSNKHISPMIYDKTKHKYSRKPLIGTKKEALYFVNERISYYHNELVNSYSPDRIRKYSFLMKLLGKERKRVLTDAKFPYMISVLNRFFMDTDEKALIFVDSKEQAQQIIHAFKNYDVGFIFYKNSDTENREIMEKFNNNELRALVAITILDEGVNLVSPNNIFILHLQRSKNKKSHLKVIQRIGRGVRGVPTIHMFTCDTPSEVRDFAALKREFPNSKFNTVNLTNVL